MARRAPLPVRRRAGAAARAAPPSRHHPRPRGGPKAHRSLNEHAPPDEHGRQLLHHVPGLDSGTRDCLPRRCRTSRPRTPLRVPATRTRSPHAHRTSERLERGRTPTRGGACSASRKRPHRSAPTRRRRKTAPGAGYYCHQDSGRRHSARAQFPCGAASPEPRRKSLPSAPNNGGLPGGFGHLRRHTAHLRRIRTSCLQRPPACPREVSRSANRPSASEAAGRGPRQQPRQLLTSELTRVRANSAASPDAGGSPAPVPGTRKDRSLASGGSTLELRQARSASGHVAPRPARFHGDRPRAPERTAARLLVARQERRDPGQPSTSLSPATPITIRPRKASRAGVEGSPRAMIPAAVTPTAPIPTQTA